MASTSDAAPRMGPTRMKLYDSKQFTSTSPQSLLTLQTTNVESLVPADLSPSVAVLVLFFRFYSVKRVRDSESLLRPVESNFIGINSIRGIFMAKRRGNPNWGKPEPIGPIVPTVTEFEQVVKEYKLTPDQYLRSTRLREWARRNKNSKYIPEPLLEAWGFEIESTL